MSFKVPTHSQGTRKVLSWAKKQWGEGTAMTLSESDDEEALESFELQQGFGGGHSMLPVFEAVMPKASGVHRRTTSVSPPSARANRMERQASEPLPNFEAEVPPAFSVAQSRKSLDQQHKHTHTRDSSSEEVTKKGKEWDGVFRTVEEQSSASSSSFSDTGSFDDFFPYNPSNTPASTAANALNSTHPPLVVPTPPPSVQGSTVSSADLNPRIQSKSIPSAPDGEHYFPELGGEYSLQDEFAEHTAGWGETMCIRWPLLISNLIKCTFGPFLLSFPLFSILVHTWQNKLEPWTTPYGTVLRSAKRGGGMTHYLLRAVEALMSAALLATLYFAYLSTDTLTYTEFILFMGLYISACIIYAVLHSVKRLRADSEWHWRNINEQWRFMEKTQVMIWCPDTKESMPMSVWDICQSVLRHSGSEVPYVKTKKTTAGIGRQTPNSSKSAAVHGGQEQGASKRVQELKERVNGGGADAKVVRMKECAERGVAKSAMNVLSVEKDSGECRHGNEDSGSPKHGSSSRCLERTKSDRRSSTPARGTPAHCVSRTSSLPAQDEISDRTHGANEGTEGDREVAQGVVGKWHKEGSTLSSQEKEHCLMKEKSTESQASGKDQHHLHRPGKPPSGKDHHHLHHHDSNLHNAAWWGAFFVAFTPLFSRFFAAFTENFTWKNVKKILAGMQAGKQIQDKVVYMIDGSFWAGVDALKRLTYGEVVCRAGLALFNFLAVLGMLYCASLAHDTYSRRLRRAGALSALLSYYEARRYGLPHFSLTSVTNIKCWVLARSWLIRQGPQYSIDTIVSVLFLITCCMWSWVCFNMIHSNSKLAVETVMVLEFAMMISYFLINIIGLGSEINHQFHDVCLFWNEQIKCNTLAVQRPHSVQAMIRCHTILDTLVKATNQAKNPINVLGLPFSHSMSRFLLTVMLSALGTVISRMLGFNILLNFGMFGL